MIWTSNQKKDTKIVAIKDEVIYLFNPKVAEIDNYVYDLNMNKIPQKNVMSIPFRYIKVIKFYENKNLIEILFASSTEEIIMSDPGKREEIFKYFDQNIPGLKYYVDSYSGPQAAKKPFIALLVVLGLFIWSYIIADGFEHGDMYDVAGQHQTRYHSIAGLVLVLASLGTKRLILVFSCLIMIAGIAVYRKMKSPFVVRTLWR
jgi:hypothetical protein